ncbi:uncharacterized protein LOC131353944 isoform X4 [Hemibagrus wyckioides]|uniref:uncharacterized protein LOC131353944 isoform X4 n=1 Tax=Hemibagrus wyckioides TaxID=337641 RepID=UPI00266C5354|nr:uncharacterized protein LOC131353944 isoform X4 [Hemibagrus wyckioides]
MPRHVSRVSARMPPRSTMRTNTGFRGNTHHTTRTHYNRGRGGVRPDQRRNPNPGFRGKTNHTTRTHSNPGVGGNVHHNRRTNPNPGRGGVRPGQRGNPNPGLRGKTHPTTSRHPNSGQKTNSTAPGVRGNVHHNKRTNPNPGNRKVLDKRKLTVQVVKSSMPPNRKSMPVLQMLKQRLKSNRVLTVHPRVQHITPAVTLNPVPVAPTFHAPAHTVSYQPQYEVHHDRRNMTPQPADHSSSQQVASSSAASAQSHKPDNSQADDESIAEITDKYLLFLEDHKSELIDKVKNVVRIVDDLELSNEKAAIVRAQLTDQAKMRKLLEFTTTKRAAERLLNVLWEQADDVMEDLTEGVEDDVGYDAGDDDNADAVTEDNTEQ